MKDNYTHINYYFLSDCFTSIWKKAQDFPFSAVGSSYQDHYGWRALDIQLCQFDFCFWIQYSRDQVERGQSPLAHLFWTEQLFFYAGECEHPLSLNPLLICVYVCNWGFLCKSLCSQVLTTVQKSFLHVGFLSTRVNTLVCPSVNIDFVSMFSVVTIDCSMPNISENNLFTIILFALVWTLVRELLFSIGNSALNFTCINLFFLYPSSLSSLTRYDISKGKFSKVSFLFFLFSNLILIIRYNSNTIIFHSVFSVFILCFIFKLLSYSQQIAFQ